MKIATIVCLILIAILYLIYSQFNPIYNERSLKINVPEARSRRFGYIIDVRSAKERELLGYYPNSIPFDRLNLPDISNKNTWILIYSGDRAAIAAETLYRAGYHNVRYITETYLSLL